MCLLGHGKQRVGFLKLHKNFIRLRIQSFHLIMSRTLSLKLAQEVLNFCFVGLQLILGVGELLL